MNQIILTGRAVNDLVVKEVGGTSLVNLTLAVDRDYKDKKGEKITDFFDVTVWRQQADFIGKYGKKGDLMGIVGQVQKRSYEKDGRNIWVTDIVAKEVSILASKEKDIIKHEPTQIVSTSNKLATDDELPF